jgi:hypothetical protein
VEHNETMATGDAGRRALLKKLGLAAGALAWATPAVQTIATAVAGAQAKTGGCSDISHLDMVVMRDGKGPYGIQWDPGEGWSKHSTSSKHCLAGLTWTQPPSTFSFSGFPTPTGNASSSYQLTLPAGVTIVGSGASLQAFSKAGQGCQRAVSLGGSTYRFDRWCSGSTTTTSTSTTTTSTTSTTVAPTTTTTGGGSGGGGGCDTDDAKREAQTFEVGYGRTSGSRGASPKTGGGSGSGDDCGSPGPGKDISHMDLIVSRPGTRRYGVQYEFGIGWGAHPSTNVSSQHCLAGLSWRVPPSSFSMKTFGSAVSLGGGAYRITLPSDVTVHDAFSKCGQVCRRATHLGGNTWRFDPC